MATTKPYPSQLLPTTPGRTLAFNDALQTAIKSHTGGSSTYGLTAIGTNQATALQLNSVYNQIDTAAGSTGVNLPLSTGTLNVPYQFCVVMNNTATTINIYGAQGSSDTINGTAGSTGITQPLNSIIIYMSSKGGAWFSDAYNSAFLNVAQTFTATQTLPSPVITGIELLSVNTAVSAAGTNLATATVLAAAINDVTTVGSGTGVALPANAVGQVVVVYSNGANNLSVYPDAVSSAIDGGTSGAAVTLTSTRRCQYTCRAAGQWISAQLGAVSS